MASRATELRTYAVFGPDGPVGDVLARARYLDDSPEKTIRLLDGREIRVPSSALQVRDDGSFFLADPQVTAEPQVTAKEPTRTAAAPEESPRPPVPREPLFESGYEVEKVRVDRILDGPVNERREGDVLILPVVEEVWVIEKKLMLREEIRIRRQKRPVTEVRTIERSA